jgi:hypothetical protein
MVDDPIHPDFEEVLRELLPLGDLARLFTAAPPLIFNAVIDRDLSGIPQLVHVRTLQAVALRALLFCNSRHGARGIRAHPFTSLISRLDPLLQQETTVFCFPENPMSNDTMIQVTIDPSLLEHVREQLALKKYPIPPDEAITSLVSIILDYSPYPLRAKQSGAREVHIAYHIRSFAQPIFE